MRRLRNHKEKLDYYEGAFRQRDELQKEHYTLTTEPKDLAIKKAIDTVAEEPILDILDIGADWGKYSVYAAQQCNLAWVTAMEITEAKVNDLNRLLDKYIEPSVRDRITAVQSDIEFYDWPDRKFDFIIATDLIEHLLDWERVWEEMLMHSRFVYALIPTGRSFEWSPDHVNFFWDDDINNMISDVTLVYGDDIVYDNNNSWYSLLVEA